MAKWKEVPAGIINGAQQRFWVAAGESAYLIANRINNEPGFAETLARFAMGEKHIVDSFFEPVTTVKVASVDSFVAAEKFCEGKTVDSIKVGWLGGNFKKKFLPKTERKSIAAEELVVNKLMKRSKDPAIITALGGEERVEISLGQFWDFLQNSWYVAYIRDIEDVLWAVRARWFSDGLFLEAFSLDVPDDWDAAARFLSR